MKLKVKNVYKQARYFNLQMPVPCFTKFIATDQDGSVWAYSGKPVFEDGYWDFPDSDLDVDLQNENHSRMFICTVDDFNEYKASKSLQSVS